MKNILLEIRVKLKASATATKRASQQRLVPGTGKMYGVPMPVLNKLSIVYKHGGFELVTLLWKGGVNEERMLALKILGKIAGEDPWHALAIAESFSFDITNWEICDALGMQALKPILATHKKDIFELAVKLSRSADPWQRRLSLVLVEWYTRDPQSHEAIRKLLRYLENDTEYYVKKAGTWVQRNLAKGK